MLVPPFPIPDCGSAAAGRQTRTIPERLVRKRPHARFANREPTNQESDGLEAASMLAFSRRIWGELVSRCLRLLRSRPRCTGHLGKRAAVGSARRRLLRAARRANQAAGQAPRRQEERKTGHVSAVPYASTNRSHFCFGSGPRLSPIQRIRDVAPRPWLLARGENPPNILGIQKNNGLV